MKKAYPPKWYQYNKKGKMRLSVLGGKLQEAKLERNKLAEDLPEPPPVVERQARLIKR